MGRLLLICRLAARDLRHRLAETILVLLAIGGAAVLTLGLILHGVTGNPYATTKAATAGPDVVAQLNGLGPAKALIGGPGVSGHSGPYPVAGAVLKTRGITTLVMAEGRDQGRAAVDQPAVTQGSWVRPDRVVFERTFAGALGLSVGDRITLNGRSFTVTGTAVTAASPPYPNLCQTSCDFAINGPPMSGSPGLIWLTEQDARSLVSSASQLLPTLPGAIIGVPLGIELFAAANGAGITTIPPASWLAATIIGTLLAMAALTAIPARIGARRSVAGILQSEMS